MEKTCTNKELALEKKEEGDEAFQKKNFPMAKKCYTEAIQLDAEEVGFHDDLAACYIEMKIYNGAIEECSKALNKVK